MSWYEPGTVAVATVRGRENVRVFCDDWDSWRHADIIGFRQTRSAFVTDIRPLVVLDLDNPQALIRDLTPTRSNHVARMRDQIEAQLKPPRIPEPGLWGVVEASPSKGSPTPRRWVRYGTGWRDAFANHLEWDDLIDPTLIREGVESDA